MLPPLLELRDVAAAHGLHGVSLALAAGERLVLLGPTGSGKTMLLRLIAGLERPARGDILLNGQSLLPLPPHRREIGFLPQRPALYPQLTIRENLQLVLDHTPPPRRGSLPAAAESLKIAHLLERRPGELSGGERQRAALARLLVRNAPIWLLDEPFAPLDPVFRADFRHDLGLLFSGSGATMILVSHDPIDALALGRLVGVLGDGRLQQLGTPEELKARPGNRFVALALGQLSLE